MRAIPRPALRSWSGHLTRIGQNRFAVARWNVIEFPILYSFFYIYLWIYLSTYLPIYLSVCLSIYLSINVSINVIIYQSMYLSIYLPIYLASIPNFCTNPWVFGFQSGQGGVSSHRSLSIWLHAGGAWPKGRRDWWHLTWFDGLIWYCIYIISDLISHRILAIRHRSEAFVFRTGAEKVPGRRKTETSGCSHHHWASSFAANLQADQVAIHSSCTLKAIISYLRRRRLRKITEETKAVWTVLSFK